MAVDINGGVADHNGNIPWRGTQFWRADMAHYKHMTEGKKLIVGRKTYELIKDTAPADYVVVSRSGLTLSAAVNRHQDNCVVIGGPILAAEAIKHPQCRGLQLSVCNFDYSCPLRMTVPNISYTTEDLRWKNHVFTNALRTYTLRDFAMNYVDRPVEYIRVLRRSSAGVDVNSDYLKVISAAINEGELRNCRGGVRCRSLFNKSISISGALPLITAKNVTYRTVLWELLWFIRGDTNADYLKQHDVKIWDLHTSRAHLDGIGHSDWPEGTIGRGYGAQWRGKSISTTAEQRLPSDRRDQLTELVERLIADPVGRRHLLVAWNVGDLDKVSLPPCHYAAQFYVSRHAITGKLQLSCLVNMRSADLMLGVPFNLASYGTLLHLVAAMCDYDPKELVITMCDAHIYEDHVAVAKKMLLDWQYRGAEHLSTTTLEFSPLLRQLLKSRNWDKIGSLCTPDDFIVRDYYSAGEYKVNLTA